MPTYQSNGRAPRAWSLADDDVPEPPAATGQYPDDVWAPAVSTATALADDDGVAEPPSATGQYPDDVWAAAPAVAAGLEADDPAEEPPAATGQYPDDVWAAARPASLALEDVSAPAPAVSSPPAAPVAAPSASAGGDTLKEPGYSDELPEMPDSLAGQLPTGLTLQEMYRVVRAVAEADSGEALYSAVSPQSDYAGREGEYAGRRFGLGFGLLLFTQASGRLGSVLALTQRRSPDLFDRVFGPAARELLAVATAPTEAERLAPVGGRGLDDPEWLERFRQAGAAEECRNAQNEEAIAHVFRPMLPWALALGLDTDRGLALLLDRVSTRGLGGGVRWAVDASGLLRDPADLDRALRHLGHADLRAFQESTRWLPVDGRPGPETTGALLARLRASGGFPLPSSAEVQARLLAAATGAAKRRLDRLSGSAALHDTRFGNP
jgi:hypothetical protein